MKKLSNRIRTVLDSNSSLNPLGFQKHLNLHNVSLPKSSNFFGILKAIKLNHYQIFSNSIQNKIMNTSLKQSSQSLSKLNTRQQYFKLTTLREWAPTNQETFLKFQEKNNLTTKEQSTIQILHFNNSQNRNSLTSEALSELNTLLRTQSSKLPAIIILSSEGPVFSSGHDLKELSLKDSSEEKSRILQLCSATMLAIRHSKSVFISEVQGLATAAGLQLAVACDLVVASSEAEFCLPGVRIGLVPLTPAVAISHGSFSKSNVGNNGENCSESGKEASVGSKTNNCSKSSKCSEELKIESKAAVKIDVSANSHSGNYSSEGQDFISEVGSVIGDGCEIGLRKVSFEMLVRANNIGVEEALKRGIINKAVDVSTGVSNEKKRSLLRLGSLEYALSILRMGSGGVFVDRQNENRNFGHFSEIKCEFFEKAR